MLLTLSGEGLLALLLAGTRLEEVLLLKAEQGALAPGQGFGQLATTRCNNYKSQIRS